MERINLERILSEDLISEIELEVSGFINDDRYKILYGQVHIGSKIEDTNVMIDSIIDVASTYYKAPKSMIMSTTRRQPFVKYRQIILYLARKYTSLSLKEIGEQIGNVDHSTVIHSIKTVKSYLETDNNFVNQVSDIEEELYFGNE